MKNNFSKPYTTLLLPSLVLMMAMGVRVSAQDPKNAKQIFDEGNYFKSIELYGKLLGKNPDDSEFNYKMGLCYLRTHIDPLKALDYLLTAEQNAKLTGEALLQLAEAYTHHLQYEDALEYLARFEKEGNLNKKNTADFERRRNAYSAALELLKYPVEVTFKNLGPSLNSSFPDYHPFVDKDEELLVFTSRRKTKPGAQPEFDGYYPSNIFMSTKKNGEWTQAVKLTDRINTSYDEQSVGLSDSGDSLFFYVDHINSFGNIYLSVKKGAAFVDPKPLNETVNTEFVESACSISRNGEVLIFSSDRPGGKGGLDIWMRRKLPNGMWGEPLNLGPDINTPFDEDFPTLSGDGRTLYFSSNGHPGMGNFDLFFSTWDLLANNWSKPQNLGYPLNTPGNEKSISFNDAGDRAYITALRTDGLGDLDIYEVTYEMPGDGHPAVFLLNLPENLKLSPQQRTTKITVKNEFYELIGEYAPNRISGSYVIALHPGKYFIALDLPGFKPYNEMIVVNKSHLRQESNLRTLKPEK